MSKRSFSECVNGSESEIKDDYKSEIKDDYKSKNKDYSKSKIKDEEEPIIIIYNIDCINTPNIKQDLGVNSVGTLDFFGTNFVKSLKIPRWSEHDFGDSDGNGNDS